MALMLTHRLLAWFPHISWVPVADSVGIIAVSVIAACWMSPSNGSLVCLVLQHIADAFFASWLGLYVDWTVGTFAIDSGVQNTCLLML